MLWLLLILIGVVIFLAGLFVMAPHAHKDRKNHYRDNDKWETPAEALSFGFWLGLAIMMIGMVFMGVAVYVSKYWMANHPELPDAVTNANRDAVKACYERKLGVAERDDSAGGFPIAVIEATTPLADFGYWLRSTWPEPVDSIAVTAGGNVKRARVRPTSQKKKALD